MTGSLVPESSAATNSFCDLAPPNESHVQENYGKNTVGPNEFTDFEKFELEHIKGPKSIHVSTSAEHPGNGITLDGKTALRIM